MRVQACTLREGAVEEIRGDGDALVLTRSGGIFTDGYTTRGYTRGRKQLVACTPCRTACLDTTWPARSPVHSPNIPDAKLRYEVGGAALTAGCSPAVAPRVNSYLVGRRGGEKKSQNPRARSDDRVLRSPQPAGSATFPEMRHADRTIAYTITCCPLGGAAPT